MPVPLNEIVAGEIGRRAHHANAACDCAQWFAGAKLTVSGKLWPAASVTPAEKTCYFESPRLRRQLAKCLTLPVPVFVSVKVCDTEFPTNVLPKLKTARAGGKQI